MLPSRILRSNASIDYLLAAIPSSKKATTTSSASNSTRPSIPIPPADPSELIITPSTLNDVFLHEEAYQSPTPGDLSRSQQFFNNAKIKLDWSHNSFDDIPDIKYNILKNERDEKFKNVEAYNRSSQYFKTASKSKKTFGITPDLLRPLPEVLLLGNTNVGKSTLINTLFLDKLDSQTAGASHEYAFVSKRAGYTKTLNCFNVNNKLRIIDTPGYGQFGERVQGEAVMDYIERRRILRTVFLLVDGLKGFTDLDVNMVEFMIEQGVSFDIIFTKLDQVIKAKLPRELSTMKRGQIAEFTDQDRIENAEKIEIANEKIIQHFNGIIDYVGFKDVPTLPRIFFNNGLSSPVLTKRYGYKEIRYAILQSCGLIKN